MIITSLDQQTVPLLIQRLTSLKETTNPQNQYYLQLLINDLQKQYSEGKYNQELLPLIQQFVQEIQANPKADISNVKVNGENDVGLLTKLNVICVHSIHRGATAIMDNTFGMVAQSNIPILGEAAGIVNTGGKVILDAGKGIFDVIFGGNKNN